MQIKSLHKNQYKLYAYARTQQCLEKYRSIYQKGVDTWEKLKKEKVSDKLCSQMSGISKSSYYRHKKILDDLNYKNILPPSKSRKNLNKPKWGESERQLVLMIRRQNPTYGKNKIAVILKRDYQKNISESTVGRIIKDLMNKGLITKSLSAPRMKKKRNFKKHAKSYEFKDYEKIGMGERVQIDHMSVTKNGIGVKHFQAWDRRSKYIKAVVYSNAKASSARKFLLELIKTCPFKIQSIQVDGGSEFMAEFETECEKLNIPLMVLPPKRPTYNGGVERGNRIFKEEFYSDKNMLEDSIRGIQAKLNKALEKYNCYRPHFCLKGQTPMEYINNNLKLAA